MTRIIFAVISIFICVQAFNINELDRQMHRLRRSSANSHRQALNHAIGRWKRDANASAELSEQSIDEKIASALISNTEKFLANAKCFSTCENVIEALSEVPDYYYNQNDTYDYYGYDYNGDNFTDYYNSTDDYIFINRTNNETDIVIEVELPQLPQKWPLGDFLENKPFNVTEFNDTCSKFVKAQDCLSDCGQGYYTNLFDQVFRPIEYMCLVAKDDFVKYAECSHEADIKSCSKNCKKLDSSEESNEKSEGFTSARNALDELCQAAPCHIDCGKPKISAACGNDENAGDVFENAVAHLIGGLVGSLEQATLGNVDEPESCKPITAKAPILASQQKKNKPEKSD